MAGRKFTTSSITTNQTTFNGGLNTTSGPFGLSDSESPDLQNIDFDRFGSILQRNGYTALNEEALSGDPTGDGLHWFEYTSGSSTVRKAIKVAGGALYKMDDLDGTWDDVTGGLTITAGNHCDFQNFLNEVYITNGNDAPFKYDGSSASAMTVPTGLTTAKFVKEFNNYLFLANVTVSGTTHKSRIYWSNLKDTDTWGATNFIEVAKDDGQEITGIFVLSDRLVIFKTRSIYNLFFTGDADIPFILPSGGKTNSTVGCIASFSIQPVDNGLVFLASDGIYFFDGANSYKISDRLNYTFSQLNQTRLSQACSLTYHKKSVYMLSLCSSGETENDTVIVWNFALNSFSLYKGIAASSMAVFWVSGTDERPYFSDYDGFTYRMDTGEDDYPLNSQTAIDSYYYTNWKPYGDLIIKKAVPECIVYYDINTGTLDFSYSYDFDEDDQYTLSFSTASSSDVYGTGAYGTATYAKAGGGIKRLDLTSRGRVVRFKFSNNRVSETWRVNGFGMYPHGETNV